MKESVDVTGIPDSDPLVGCGCILFTIGALGILAMIGYLIFISVSLYALILYTSLLCIIIGFVLYNLKVKQL